MKYLLLGLLSFAAFAGTPVKKYVPIENVFIPKGFDSNDEVEIVVTGFLPNLCHKSPRAQVEIKDSKITVEVKSYYYDPSSPFCPDVIVPFVKTVTVGFLESGKYKVEVNDDTQWEIEENIFIEKESSIRVDDYRYAYVNYVDLDKSKDVVTLRGYNPSDCFQLDRIESIFNGDDTLTVLPIMKQVSDFCPRKMIPFEYEWSLPEGLVKKEILLHVRTLNGDAVNTIYLNN